MHINAKKMVLGGLLLALTVVCMSLGSVIETNTLFLLAAASYFVGIMIRESGKRMGAAFYLGALLLGLIIAPNKLYVLSFAAMGLYILIIEFTWDQLGKAPEKINRTALLWGIKYMIFNLLYIPVLLLFQQILFGRQLPSLWLLGIILAGQGGLWVYDRAYGYVQQHIWGKLRGRLLS
jgi:hypothetical protein